MAIMTDTQYMQKFTVRKLFRFLRDTHNVVISREEELSKVLLSRKAASLNLQESAIDDWLTNWDQPSPIADPPTSSETEEERKARRQRVEPIPDSLLKDILIAHAPWQRREQDLLRRGVRTTDSEYVTDCLRVRYVDLENQAMELAPEYYMRWKMENGGHGTWKVEEGKEE
jgi:hypothetical protein